jgi:hypothetical protein
MPQSEAEKLDLTEIGPDVYAVLHVLRVERKSAQFCFLIGLFCPEVPLKQ